MYAIGTQIVEDMGVLDAEIVKEYDGHVLARQAAGDAFDLLSPRHLRCLRFPRLPHTSHA